MGLQVAFQGVEGAYSELAAQRFFGKRGLEVKPLAEFAAVFRAVTARSVGYGILPVENSLTGSIHQNYDLMLDFAVHIVGEIKLPVAHSLLVPKGVALADIREVYSHPQALAQCARFLRTHLKKAAVVSYFDTAGSARFVAGSERRDIASIASLVAGKRYKLTPLKEGIQDHRDNFTRFLVIRRGLAPRGTAAKSKVKGAAKTEALKTSVVFSLKNAQGALYKSLSAFAVRDIDLLKIESRPIPGKPWHYMFYLDFVAPKDAEVSRRALDHLSEAADFVRMLGTYPPG